MVNVILIAPPAAGKGTISKYLVEKYGYTHLSTGDLLRNEIKLETEIGMQVKEIMASGKFTPDEIILPLFKSEIMKMKDKPFILDGMPRKLNQAEYITELFEEMNVDNYVVINLTANQEVLERRIVGRRVCNKCESSYNIYFEGFKPKEENICDKCNTKLIQREDDNIESFRNRYEDYNREAEPLIRYYKEKNLLNTIDVSLPNSEIIANVEKLIHGEQND